MTNSKETKPQIKLNRKMRLWNKYKMIGITALIILAAVIVVTAATKSISGSKNKSRKDVTSNVTTAQEQSSSQSDVSQTTTAQETTQTATQEQTTQAQVKSGSTLTLSGTAAAEQFTSKEFFEDTVFLGDSVISGISTYGYLDNVYGNVNATSAKLEDYVSTAMANKPSKVFIMVGHNDANYGTIKEETLSENIISIVEAIHKSNSSTKVYVLSITPITSAYEKKTSINVEQSYIDTANSLIEENASANNYTYIDVASAYKDGSGYMNTDCTGNGINLTSSYYPFLLNGIASVAK